MRLLAEYGRLNGVADIRQIFEQQRATLEGLSHVTVTSAYEMDESQQNSLQSAISKRLGTEVDLTVDVDSSLIGGVVIRAGDTVIDASLRGRPTPARGDQRPSPWHCRTFHTRPHQSSRASSGCG